MEENRFYVYVWYNDDTGLPFYVGKGTGNRYKKKTQSHRSEWFTNVVNKHSCHPEILYNDLSEDEAFCLEVEIIKCFRDQGIKLVNLTDGGEGCSGREADDEYRLKYHYMCLGENNPNYGNKWNDEQKQHLSEIRKELSLARYGKNPRALPVMCVETGEKYSCQQEAADFLGLKSMVSINHALKERRFTAKGFHFVCGDDIERLDSKEKRANYIREIEIEKVALRSDAY